MNFQSRYLIPAQADSPTTAAYCFLLQRVIQTSDRAYVFNYGLADLVARRVAISTTHGSDGSALAGFFSVRQGDGAVYIGGATTDPEHRRSGLMLPLLRQSISRLLSEDESAGFELDIRVINGEPNPKALRLFSRLGFVAAQQPTRVAISGTELDRHLFESAEPDGKHFYALKMRATANSLREAFRE